MDSKAKLAGHPIHPMLVVIPLGLFVMATLVDIYGALRNTSAFDSVSFWNIVGGIVGGLAAALFGWIDWFAIPKNTRAKRIGLIHGLGNGVLLVLFAIAAYMRWQNDELASTSTTLTLEVIALALGTVTGWLGGELVNRLGVGVDDGAHVDAPSSLSVPSLTRERLGESAHRA